MRRVSLNARRAFDAELSDQVEVALFRFEHSALAAPVLLSTDPTVRLGTDPLTYGTRSAWMGADPASEPYLFVLASVLVALPLYVYFHGDFFRDEFLLRMSLANFGPLYDGMAEGEEDIDMVPFVVSSTPGETGNTLCFLAPTVSYLAYSRPTVVGLFSESWSFLRPIHIA